MIIDGREAARECVLLSINLVSQKRALPLCWLVVKGKKGPLSEQTPIQLVQKVADLLPPEHAVVFVGDGELDGVELLGTLHDLGWDYVWRTAKNVVLSEAGERFCPTDLLLEPGDQIEVPEVGFTAAGYGPVVVSVIWEPRWKEPLILVSTLDFLAEAYGWYRRRFRIERFFSDQKSRGFFLGHSHMSDTVPLERLLMGRCLAYLWMVCLGAWVVQSGNLALIHRAHRCDWRVFHIGLCWSEHCLNEGLPSLVSFALLGGAAKSVG